MRQSILVFSSSDWDGNWGSRQQIAERWAQRGHLVVFVEQMAGMEHFIKYPDLRQRRRRQIDVRRLQDRLWLLTPPVLLPGRYYFPLINYVNAQIVGRWLRRQLDDLAFIPTLLWCYKPEHAAVAAHWQDIALVYHCIDEFSVGTHGWKRANIIKQETDLLNRADVVFANSNLTYENKRRINPQTYHIPSGADVAHFKRADNPKTTIPPLVASLPSPIMMFVGNINEKINISLLASVARERPEWTIVLIGQVYGNADKQLQKFDNVYCLGRQPFSQLPNFFRSADVCLLPYVESEVTRYRSPLKLYEYLATGKPIVSTPHPEVKEFSDIISIAPPEKFVSAIEDVLQHDNQSARIKRFQIVSQHSWDVRVDQMESILQKRLTVW
ncbi:MAG TPA: glycosyltransferase family 1 protein [Anaerolineae bacterium]|nr:glycosyltransferase family 1 protein [Anaerolineae bacterium]